MSEELKPCPHCGSSDLAIHEGYIKDHIMLSAVMCHSCACAGAWAVDKEEAIRRWNMRIEPRAVSPVDEAHHKFEVCSSVTGRQSAIASDAQEVIEATKFASFIDTSCLHINCGEVEGLDVARTARAIVTRDKARDETLLKAAAADRLLEKLGIKDDGGIIHRCKPITAKELRATITGKVEQNE